MYDHFADLTSSGTTNHCGSVPVTSHIRHYAFYTISGFGVISNILVLAVFIYSKRLHGSVSGVFLLSLTISDSLFLITEQIDSSSRSPVTEQMIHMSEFMCGFISYLKFSSRFAATAIVLCISANRFIVVGYPIRSYRFRTIKCAVIQIIVVSILAAISGIYAFSSIGTSECGCLPFENNIYSLGVTVIDIILCDLIASLLICIFSIRTICIFRKSGEQRIFKRQDSQTSICRKENERHMTVLLLTVAVTFVLLRLPYTLTWTPYWFLVQMNQNSFSTSTDEYHVLDEIIDIAQIFFFLNHAVNLYLYCLCSKGFRDDFARMIHIKASSGRLSSRQSNMKMSTFRSRSGTKSTSSNMMSDTVQATGVGLESYDRHNGVATKESSTFQAVCR